MDKIRSAWAKVPSAIQVIIYSGVSVFIGQILADIAKIEAIWVPYVTIVLTVCVNLVSYLILREKQNG